MPHPNVSTSGWDRLFCAIIGFFAGGIFSLVVELFRFGIGATTELEGMVMLGCAIIGAAVGGMVGLRIIRIFLGTAVLTGVALFPDVLIPFWQARSKRWMFSLFLLFCVSLIALLFR